MRLFRLAAGVLALTGSVSAHHSLTAIYDRSNQVTMEGSVAEFHLVNPHAFLTMEVVKNGRSEVWKLELDNRGELASIGITPDTLRRGDLIVAKGSAARDGSRTIYALRIDRRADGFWYEQVGSSPKIGRGR